MISHLEQMTRRYSENGLTPYEIADAFPVESKSFVSKNSNDLKEYARCYRYIDERYNPLMKVLLLANLKLDMGKEKVNMLNYVASLAMIMNNKKRDNMNNSDIYIAKSYQIADLHHFKRKRKHEHGFMACCPFGTHEDKHPSFGVKHNFYTCFSCGKKGDSIQFIMDLNNMPFEKAVKYIRNLQNPT